MLIYLECYVVLFLSSIHSFSRLLIIHRVVGEPEAYPRELGAQGNTLDGVPDHRREQSHTHSLKHMSLD